MNDLTVEYTVMDYEGEPVYICEGEICEDDDPPMYFDESRDRVERMQWNSRYCCYEEQEPEPYDPEDSLSRLEERYWYRDRI